MHPAFKDHLNIFLRNNDVVVGSPFVFFYAGEHAVLNGGLGIVQQLPRRVWVGLRYGSDVQGPGQRISIPAMKGNHRIFLSDNKTVVDFDDLKAPPKVTEWRYKTKPLQNLVNGLFSRDTIKKNLVNLDGLPLTVNILSELRSMAGCNFSGAFSSALVIALCIAADRFNVFKNKDLMEQCHLDNGKYILNWNKFYPPPTRKSQKHS
jgi:hypothetical protein